MVANAGFLKSAARPAFGGFGRNLLVGFVVLVLSAAPPGFTQQEPLLLSEQAPAPAETNIVSAQPAPAVPFAAEITANDVYVRSGPGTNYYHCSKLHRGDKVEVVKTQPGWSCIAPPQGCFSWVAMQYLALNLDNPTVGAVTGNGVWVYAGSDYVEPIHSTSKQIMLNRGDKVRLLGEEKDDYCKIATPEGAYLWVSSDYVETIGPLGQKILLGTVTTEETADANVTVEQTRLKEFDALKEKAKAERAKPLQQQKYDDIKKELTGLAKTAEAGKAAMYAEAMLQQIAGFELAQEVAKQVEQQNARLRETTSKIDKTAESRMTEVKDLGRFVVIGKLQGSSIYDTGPGGASRYRIIGESGTTVCYAIPTGAAAQLDLSKFVGKKVGLVGTIKPHQPTAGAMVQFTEIVKLD